MFYDHIHSRKKEMKAWHYVITSGRVICMDVSRSHGSNKITTLQVLITSAGFSNRTRPAPAASPLSNRETSTYSCCWVGKKEELGIGEGDLDVGRTLTRMPVRRSFSSMVCSRWSALIPPTGMNPGLVLWRLVARGRLLVVEEAGYWWNDEDAATRREGNSVPARWPGRSGKHCRVGGRGRRRAAGDGDVPSSIHSTTAKHGIHDCGPFGTYLLWISAKSRIKRTCPFT
jgi:hypothetical protein